MTKAKRFRVGQVIAKVCFVDGRKFIRYEALNKDYPQSPAKGMRGSGYCRGLTKREAGRN